MEGCSTCPIIVRLAKSQRAVDRSMSIDVSALETNGDLWSITLHLVFVTCMILKLHHLAIGLC